MRNFSAVIFDMDGLLLDTERLAFDAFQTICSRFGLGDLSELFKQCIGTNDELGKAILKNGLEGIADFKEFGLAWMREYKRVTTEQPIPLKHGVEKLLSHIESIEVPMAVATSTQTKRAKEKLGVTGLLDYFEIVIGGDQVERGKPDPDIYLKAASVLSADPSKCLALEDSTNGVKAAVAAGMTVVQIPDLVQPSEELLQLGHIVLSSLADVPKYDFQMSVQP
jgi:HAD superfamily hydrolase (TIGR01509 family)